MVIERRVVAEAPPDTVTGETVSNQNEQQETKWTGCLLTYKYRSQIVSLCMSECLYLPTFPFMQIDWGDLCSSVEEVNFGTTVEQGMDWESGKEVMHKHLVLYHCIVTIACDCINTHAHTTLQKRIS